MDIRVAVGDITRWEGDALLVNLFEGVTEPGGGTGAVDRALDGALRELIRTGELTGKKGEVVSLTPMGRLPVRRVLVVGLGKREDFGPEAVRYAMGEAVRALRRLKARRVATLAHGTGAGGLSPLEAGQAIAEGALLGLYRFRKYKTVNEETDPEELTVLVPEGGPVSALEEGVQTGRVLAEAVNRCRDLVNEPPNELTPTRLAEHALALAEDGGLEARILEREECERLGMGAFLAVAQGSHQPPKFIVLTYRGAPEREERDLALLGKGITFDSGGLSLKPASAMEDMKGDMAGGASVLCALHAIARLRVPINACAIVPATENMPGGGATRPGDVVRTMDGKTVEVLNTDAEGRMALADALAYARREGYRRLVDVATLTGAIVVALGSTRIGLFASDDDLAGRLARLGEALGERMWRMPMDEDYRELIKSQVADIKNVGKGRDAGSITAAWFLREFAHDTPWAHLDIAGVFMADQDKGYQVRGATGIPVRTLVALARDLAQSPTTRT